MNKHFTGRFHKQEEFHNFHLSESRSMDSDFTQMDYQQIKEDLTIIHNEAKTLFQKLVYSNPSKYFRLAKIVDMSLEELILKINGKAATEFPETQKNERPELLEVDDDDAENIWKKLCHLEPRLGDLLREAKEIKDTQKHKSFCKYDVFGDKFVDRLSELLGSWIDNHNPLLQDMKSLEFAKETIINALPACRNCKKHSIKFNKTIQA